MALSFVTGNDGKFAEMKKLLPDIEMLPLDLPEIQSTDLQKIVEHKLRSALTHKQGELIIEDTALYIDGMGNLPGPLIKWFVEELDIESIYRMARAMGDCTARAVTMIGYAKNADELHFFEGTLVGSLVEPRTEEGFAWDRIFVPVGRSRTFAEMSKEEKNKISMRKYAAEKLKEFLG